MQFLGAIPEIDLTPLADASDLGHRAVADEVRVAFTTVGFAYLCGHGVPPALTGAAFAAARQFHALPLERKLRVRQNRFFRGYLPLAGSRLALTSLGEARRPNQSEAFVVAHEVPESDPDYQAGDCLAGPNQWPEDLPGFRPAVSAYFDALQALAQRLVRVFAVAFGLAPDGLAELFRAPTMFMRLQHYPRQARRIPADQFGLAPHTDYGFLTLLAQDDVPGLQVQDLAGHWIDVPPRPGTLVLNSGDMISRLSNDCFLSTPHRVINRSGRRRYTIPFFFEPSMHARIAPLAPFRDGPSPGKYPPIEYADHLMARIRSNYSIGA
ncbi:MAG: isopenicillin N synthase family oxygenase [Pelomonas sp.]|nr:isopenicillin N synthase family oxygenase [Roseateles sp.]